MANGLSEEAKDTMGVFDFVQKNVSQMMIARPDHLKHLIVYKHPDQNFPMYSQLTIDSDECAVFFKDGRVVGVLPPGRHTMHTQNIPFLGSIVNQFTGGNVFISEIFFVKTVPVRSIPFGGPAGEIVDPGTGLQVPIRIFGEFSVVVTDPVRFIVGYSGQAAAGDNDQILQWVKGKFINSVGTVLCELAEAEQKSILSVINNKERLAQAFVTRAPALNDIGIRITEMGKIDPNIPEEHMVELRAAVKELADAQREVRKKQIAIAGAAADAQANQFSLDQKFNQDARYVNQLAGGNFGAYAAGQAMIGAGQGMAAHGMGDGLAGAGAGMAVGVGMGNMMAGQFNQGMMGAPPPPPASISAGGVLVTCGACQFKQAAGKFCSNCGTGLPQAPKNCTGCGTMLTVGAKFCANCGTKTA